MPLSRLLRRVPDAMCAALLCLAAGCGSEEPAVTPAPDRAADERTAKGAVLKLADMPPTWKDAGGGGDAASGCGSIDAARKLVTGEETSSRFEHHETAQVQTSAFVFPDAQTAQKGYARLANQATTKCLSDALVEGLGSDEVGRIRTSSLRIDALGDHSQGTRIVVPVTGEDVEAEINVDVVYVRAGRGVVLAYFVEAHEPFGEPLRDELTGIVAKRLR